MIRRLSSMLTAAAVLTLLLSTLGCGNKGPLYLPKADSAPSDTTATTEKDD